MSKDPAFLFYINDYRSGTRFKGHTPEFKAILRGCYMELLLEQADPGELTDPIIRDILGIMYEKVWPILKDKFVEKNGNFYNVKMKKVLKQRKLFCESRRGNRLGKTKIDKNHVKNMRKSQELLMENENRNKDKDTNKEKDINIIYKSYPSKCPINESATGKSSKSKKKIENLLKKHTVEYLLDLQEKYLNDCVISNRYIKNYDTFLNNLPDPDQFKSEAESRAELVKDIKAETERLAHIDVDVLLSKIWDNVKIKITNPKKWYKTATIINMNRVLVFLKTYG